MTRRIVLTFSVYIVEGNGQVSYNFLTIGLKGAWMVLMTQEQINLYLSLCFLIWLMPNWQKS